MLKSILKINGVQELNRKEQQSVSGGNRNPVFFGCESIPGATCATGRICCQDVCVRPDNIICDPDFF
ncbi:hypothetical protein [Aquimarina algicola]|uniref:Bacteriocin n=1 Tax=Aquimarina algicola TaxID=2589995 RepID=A0A504JAP2_9FLAO|nr:hypothetical protein [Aquimarina algicola]TPN87734.1 hypothetical protein FHK87_09155 [Aquimarina algicola]